ncbi:MAG: hypothetical protein VKS61_06550 [Candidatus Sericytochromatia bacterium]|nr:hypothetical protein [Candidatus Sericytochromatia bacterium]
MPSAAPTRRSPPSPAARAALVAVAQAAAPVQALLSDRAPGLLAALAALEAHPGSDAEVRTTLQATMAELQRITPGAASREALAALRGVLMEAGTALGRPPARPAARPAPARPVVHRPAPRPRPTAWARLAGLVVALVPVLTCTSPSQVVCAAGLGLLARAR